MISGQAAEHLACKTCQGWTDWPPDCSHETLPIRYEARAV
jgi:hypothetical protein